jgi:hypothetical protein
MMDFLLWTGAAGWTVGIVATPFDEEEQTKFSEILKGFLALGSGYAIAKLEGPIVEAATAAIKVDGSGIAVRIALFTTCFLVGLLFTLVTRLYGSAESESLQVVAHREKIAARGNDGSSRF